MNIDHTANKLKQLGIPVRLKGNEDDKRRILTRLCRDNFIAPVLDEELRDEVKS